MSDGVSRALVLLKFIYFLLSYDGKQFYLLGGVEGWDYSATCVSLLSCEDHACPNWVISDL